MRRGASLKALPASVCLATNRRLPTFVWFRLGSIVRARVVRIAVDVGFAAGYDCEQPAWNGRFATWLGASFEGRGALLQPMAERCFTSI